jgi:hypothetical protein
MLTHISKRSESPISGWPMNVVKSALEENDKPKDQADRNDFYPLLTLDLKPVIQDCVMPLLFAFGTQNGAMLVGWPKRGKTPLAIIMAMAMGRYNIRKCGLNLAQACYRRGKQFDVFRKKVGEIFESILLDDPTLHKLLIEDLCSFGELAESGHSDCRFTPAKWVKGQFRAVLSNVWSEEFEPGPSSDQEISFKTFLLMMRKAWGTQTPSMQLALYSRYTVIIAGKHALYVRPPSDDENATIFRFTEGDVANDFLIHPGNKFALTAFKNHERVEYEGYAEKMNEEQALIDEIQSQTRAMDPAAKIKWWVDWVAATRGNLAANADQPTPVRHVAATPTQEATASVFPVANGLPIASYQIPFARASSATTDKRNRFVIPGDRKRTAASSSTNETSVVKTEKGHPIPVGPITIEDSPPPKLKKSRSTNTGIIPSQGSQAAFFDDFAQDTDDEEQAIALAKSQSIA